LIVLLFYGYTAVSGRNYLLLDVGIFIVAVFAAEFLGHGIMWTQIGFWTRVGACTVLAVAIVAFSTLSFQPPAFFLFEEPTQRGRAAAICTHGSCWHATSDNKTVSAARRFPAAWSAYTM
jgi:hypothetical protein